MGLLRFLFATGVLIWHSGYIFGINIVDDTVAVNSFYLISGFYMALILNKKYVGKNGSYRLFITNRFLRIYPLYLLTLAAMVIFIGLKFFFHVGDPDNVITHYLTYYRPTFSFFFDLVNFIIRNLTLIITYDYFKTPDATGGYLIVQQAFTLQVELLFYLLVPFLWKLSNKWLTASCIVYLLVYFLFLLPKGIIPQKSLSEVFLNSLVYFYLGLFSYRFLYERIEKKSPAHTILLGIFICFVLYAFAHQFNVIKIPFALFQIQDVVYYLLLFLVLPFIFFFTKTNSLDRLIGELSYPIYITHMFFVKLLTNMPYFHNQAVLRTLGSVVLTVGVSYLIVRFFELPLDRFRQARLKVPHPRTKKS